MRMRWLFLALRIRIKFLNIFSVREFTRWGAVLRFEIYVVTRTLIANYKRVKRFEQFQKEAPTEMADTVKKSRIVSEEDKDMEAALLEEFNIRLKKCMSNDDLQKEAEPPEPHEIYESVGVDNLHENYYEEPSDVLENGHDDENIYENIPEKTERSDQNDLAVAGIEDHYEELEEAHVPLPTTFLTDYSESKSPESDGKASVKNRMLLCTDDTSTLLFTQTVTSPMLTPSEENIDFLKGFQREPINSDGALSSAPPLLEDENFYENASFFKNTTPENMYENLRLDDNVYDNLEFDKGENIYQTVEECSEDRKSEGSLEEFIRNERESSGGFEETKNLETSKVITKSETVVTKEKSIETYSEMVYHARSETGSNYYEKYTEVLLKNSKNEIGNREKDTETVPAEIVKNLKSQLWNCKSGAEVVGTVKKEGVKEAKAGVNIVDQIKKFEHSDEDKAEDSTEYSETIMESNSPGEMIIKKKKTKKTRKEEKENISVKSSFSKFDALQKKNVLHVRSSDSTKAHEKFNGAQIDVTNCKACGKQVFQMEQMKAEKAIWHKNCFRCTECNKQLTVDTYESNEGSLYCKPHFKALFAPKAVEEDTPAPKSRRPELIIRENQPVELPPDVVRASDKPDLGLEELQSLNVKERFQVFEHYQTETSQTETERGNINVKRSPSILSKLAKFQKHGMDVGVSNEALDGIPVEESSSEGEEEEEILEGEDKDLVRAKRVQKEKPFHFTGMSDVKKKWESGDQSKEERREERKQEIQSIRNKLFMGKQEKMKEAYQQAVMESESSTNLRKNLAEKIEICDTKSIKERFEKGEVANDKTNRERNNEDEEVYESDMSKKSRSLFLELDASASKPPQISPTSPPKLEVKKAREAYLAKRSNEDTVKSTEYVEDIEVKTADIQERFKFFETYKEPEKQRKQFRMTPPRDPSQVKTETPEREIYRDPEVIRSEEIVDDSVIAKETHTASKMLNKFRQMEENLQREPESTGPKPLKRFTPPPEPAKPESNSEEESGSEYEEEEEEEVDHCRLPEDVIEAQKAARARQLRAKFEKWEANEIKKEQQNMVNVVEEYGEEQSQIESTRVLRARFESIQQSSTDKSRAPRVKPGRFVDVSKVTEKCDSCKTKVYPLEKLSLHGNIYHKNCFRCVECSCILRMDSYSYNKGSLYCMTHFKRLFISKGDYDTAFGMDQRKQKWKTTVSA
ncbi:F-actin-monooxygenase MICAL3 isoform X10 [Cylas formicarius]|uniref:F-actin-monooxygenase MICAL3 isoform X10 n=1 Tax=Cylas formicarius TaxID=197179 RepID=UPI002958A52D|nr:F-actin-monooxygenase MICAL3 isoform X10 [Cylas formicarius]